MPGASQIFNIVFFVTILSLILQGTTVIGTANKLHLVDNKSPEDEDFDVELAVEHPISLNTLVLTSADLENGDTLCNVRLPEGGLVMMIRRRGRYIVPDGKKRLLPGDALLIIREEDSGEKGAK